MAKGTVNKVMLVGRVGKDPDIRYSPSGMAIAKFSLATNENVPAGEGKWEERTEWHRIVAFAKLAEVCGNYVSKGRLVYVEGSIRSNQWEDDQGQKRTQYEIIARDMQLLGSSEGQRQSQGQSEAPPQGQWQGQGQGQPSHSQAQPANQGQARSAYQGQTRNTGRTAVEELPPNMGPPDDDIPF